MAHRDPVISAAELTALEDVVLVDARPGEAGQAAYREAHLVDAHHVDLDRDLSAPVRDAARGGRHPLPDVDAFRALLAKLGVTPGREVVVYDDMGGAHAAARLWWLLRALGHAQVRVLDGGLAAAVSAGLQTTAEMPPPHAAPPYPAYGFTALPRADAAEVERARVDPTRRVVDVRAAGRYRGEHEPIDPVAGHIPGAINLPLTDNLTAQGGFKSPRALRAMYEEALAGTAPEKAIVHCGSGVTACHSLLAMERAGLPGAALYVGSWSEWCRNP